MSLCMAGIISAGYVEELKNERRERLTNLQGREHARADMQRGTFPHDGDKQIKGTRGSSSDNVDDPSTSSCSSAGKISALRDQLERSTQTAFLASLQHQELAELSRMLNQANSELCIYALSKPGNPF